MSVFVGGEEINGLENYFGFVCFWSRETSRSGADTVAASVAAVVVRAVARKLFSEPNALATGI